jgi:hypothetical protein
VVRGRISAVPQSWIVRRWAGVPAPAAAVGVLICVVLAYGAVLHLVQLLVDDRSALVGAPPWLAAFFQSLVVLDPVAALLLALRTRAGVLLAAAVLVCDALANAYSNYVLSPGSGITLGRAAVVVIAALAVAMVAAAPRLWRRA